MQQKILYRYERDYSLYKWVWVTLKQYNIVRETKSCYVIKKIQYLPKETFVLKHSKKAFAYIDKNKALINAIERTKHCIWITTNKLNNAKAFLESLNNINK